MAELGIRGNVMGPQAIARAKPLPPVMIETAERVLAMLKSADAEGLAAIATLTAVSQISPLAGAVGPGLYDRHEIIAVARLINHYYVKARLFSETADPFTVQFRLGEKDGVWLLWEAIGLTGRHADWQR